MTMQLQEIAREVGVKIVELRRVLWIVYSQGPIENSELIRQTGIPKSIIRDLKKKLSAILKSASNIIELTDEGKNYIGKMLTPEAASPGLMDIPLAGHEHLVKLLRKYQYDRPVPKRNLDQFRATEETVVKRGILMLEQGDIEGRDILVLGDNDLTSIVIASFGCANRVCVVDVDDRVLKVIGMIATEEGLNLDCIEYNAKHPLPSLLKKSFDVVFTDPPYTPEGFGLFLSRAIAAVRDGNGRNNSIIYFCFGYSRRSNERGLRIQEITTQSGVLIETKIGGFNSYYAAGAVGSSSSLYICSTTPKTTPLVTGHFRGRVYTGKTKRRREDSYIRQIGIKESK